tara:strand:- start:242 stop:844 length:603 start_codon:yes stop_codon:yes gene_type:complete
MSAIMLVRDTANNRNVVLQVNGSNELGISASSLPLPTGAALESSLSSLNGKVTACNTGAVVVSSSALPSGAASAANQSTGNSSLSAIDSKLAGTLTVSMGVVRSNGTITNNASVTAGDKTSSIDCNAAKEVAIYGNSSTDTQVIKVQVSDDDSVWYETDIYIYPNSTGNDFYKKFASCARYYRLHYEGTATMTAKYSMVN